jgi:membrane protein YdbS with pleckstrin-like domain
MDDREQIDEPDPTEVEAAEPTAGPELPPLVDGEDHPVDPRSVYIVRLIAIPVILAITVFPLLFFTLGRIFNQIPVTVFLAVLATLLLLSGLALIIAYHFPAVRHRHLRYRVDPEGLRIQQGVFWRKTVWIPITRVQHTDVSQGPLQRKYDLATLTVHTAGTAGASIPLPGLEHSVAIRLSDHLHPNRKPDAG